MELSKQEIATKLENEKEILQAVRERLQQLELREARQGFNTPAEVVTEIKELAKRIARHEEEIRRLQTQSAEDKIPLAEAEYRAVIAEVWQSGKPTVAGTARQELARLQLGLVPEQAQRIEQSVRTALAEETIDRLSKLYLEQRTAHLAESSQLIAHAVRLDPQTTLRVLTKRIPRTPDPPFSIEYFKQRFLELNEVWPEEAQYDLYQQFLADFGAALAERWPTMRIADNS